MELPLYSGEQHATPRVPQPVSMPHQSPFADLFSAARRAGIAAADELDNALVKRYDDGLEFTREAKTRRVEADAREEITRRSALAPGHADSFWNEDGTYRKEVARELMKRVSSSLQGLDKGFVSPDAQQKAIEAQDKAIFGIQAMMQSTIASQVSRRTREAYQDAYNLAMAQNDFDAAADATYRAEDNGSISEQEAQLAREKISKAEHEFVIDNLAIDGSLDSLEAMAYEDDKLPFDSEEKLPPDVRQRLQRYIDTLRSERTAATLQPFRSPKGSASPQKADPNADLRDGLPAEYLNLYYANHQNLKDPTATQQAEQQASIIAARMMTTPGSLEEAENFKRAMSVFGVSDSYLNAVIATRKEFLNKAVEFNPEEAFKAIPKYNFFREGKDGVYNVSKIRRWQSELAEIDQQIADRLTAGDKPDEELTNKHKALVGSLARWDNYEKEERKKAQAYIEGEYARWYLNKKSTNEKGAAPNPRECATAFYDITNKYLARVDRSLAGDYRTHQTQLAAASWDALMREKALAEQSIAAGRESLEKLKASMPEQPVTEEEFLNYAETEIFHPVSDKEKQDKLEGFFDSAVIYVPRNHPSANQKVTIRESVKGKQLTVPCIATKDIGVPLLSAKLLSQLTGDQEPQNYNSLSILRDRAELHYDKQVSLFPYDASVSVSEAPNDGEETDDGLPPHEDWHDNP